jgi:hypothetical protein
MALRRGLRGSAILDLVDSSSEARIEHTPSDLPL